MAYLQCIHFSFPKYVNCRGSAQLYVSAHVHMEEIMTLGAS
jgi:hypothetical protein